MWLALDPTVFFLYQPVPQIIKTISWIWKYFPASSKYHYFGQCCIEVNWCEGMAWPINPDLSILICRSWPVNTCTLWDLFSLRIRPSFDLSGAVVMRSAGGWGTACPEELLSHTCFALPCLLPLASSQVADWGGGCNLHFISFNPARHARTKKSSQETRVEKRIRP